jgi:hypothetical protein
VWLQPPRIGYPFPPVHTYITTYTKSFISHIGVCTSSTCLLKPLVAHGITSTWSHNPKMAHTLLCMCLHIQILLNYTQRLLFSPHHQANNLILTSGILFIFISFYNDFFLSHITKMLHSFCHQNQSRSSLLDKPHAPLLYHHFYGTFLP